MLIIAGVTITALSGDNGILKNAAKAKEETEKAEEEESSKLAALEAATNLKNIEYIDVNGDKAIIPAGFTVSKVEGENIIKDGLVIIDSEENEFVWVPVSIEKFETDFIRKDGYSAGVQQQYLEATGEADETGVNENFEETKITQAEAIEMYKSVKLNHGFYIGRYEAGKNNDGSVAVKRGLEAYRKIPWSANGQMRETESTTGGAVELSRSFDTNNSYLSVKSTLVYGVQWDFIMKWMEDIENSHSTGSLKKYIQDSTEMGWYKDNYLDGNVEHLTGIDLKNEKNKVKNIYDLAGNVREWTMESYLDTGRFARGGDYYNNGMDTPASVRYGNLSPSSSTGEFGFRIALYLI